MAINKRGVYEPDFNPDMQMPEWQNMGDDQQVNISPAVGAFQSRFMGGNKGDTNNVLTPTAGDLPMDMGGMDAGGGSPVKGKGIKSL